MDTNTQTFWDWFTAHTEQLTMLADLADEERTSLIDQLDNQLQAYCPGLTCEIGEQTTNGRTLTISAEGDFDLFRYVVDLVDNAPDIDWWEFVAFKQPKGTNLRVQFDLYHFDTSQMYFLQLQNDEEPEILGLRVALPTAMMQPQSKKKASPEEEDDLLVGVYVTLEALIGEFDCTTLVGYLETCPVPENPQKEGFRPLDEFPKFIEWFKSQQQ